MSYITGPANTVRLNRMVLDFAAIDARVEKEGPRQCCSEFAFVVVCADDIDSWKCGCCLRTWEASCR